MEALEPAAYVKNTVCFSKENFAKLQQMMYEQYIPAGSHLFWEGDPADKLFFIKEGCVKITKSTNEGKEYILCLNHKGDLLGQLDPYPDSKQSFHAKTLQDCVVGILQKNDLEVLLWQHGDFAVEFMKWMGLTQRMIQTKFRDLMLYGKPGALCSTLIRLGNTYGKQVENGLLISRKLTNVELADYISAARESVNRILSNLKKANAIDFADGYITITNLDYLKKICFCEDCPIEICRI